MHKDLVDVWHDKDPGASKFLGAEGAHLNGRKSAGDVMMRTFGRTSATVTGYVCACDAPSAPTRPAVVLDPFGGTCTTALAARAEGRIGWAVDLSADYCRLGRWRVTDPGELARALEVPKPPPVPAGSDALFDLEGA